MARPILSVKNLTIQTKVKPLFQNISFCVSRGDLFAVSGVKSSGKTTLIKSLMGLVSEGISGEIHYVGVGKGEITYIPQNILTKPEKFIGTVREIVAYAYINHYKKATIAPQDWQKVDVALGIFGLESIREKNVEKLTAIQTYKMKLAKALVCDPKVMYIDDPATSITAKAKTELYKTLRYISTNMGIAIILITPEAKSIVSLADKMLFLDREDQNFFFGTCGEYCEVYNVFAKKSPCGKKKDKE